MANQYYECEFAKGTEDNYTSNGYSICIVAKREPTLEEATEFLKQDLEYIGYDFVSNIFPLTYEEAHDMFDMDNEENFPVFE